MANQITADSANQVLANLLNIYNGEIAYINGQWYAPFSGQPEANLGALKIAYTTGSQALSDTLADTLAGNKSSDDWVALANTTEQSMRAIASYSDQASATSEVQYVVQQTGQQVAQGITKAANVVQQGLWAGFVAAFKGSPFLVIGAIVAVLAVLFVIFKPGIDAARSVVKD